MHPALSRSLPGALLARSLLAAALAPAAPAFDGPDFQAEIRPILESRCLSCHTRTSARGRLSLESRESLLRGGAGGPVLVPGDAGASPLVQRLRHPDPRKRMPRNADPLGEAEVERLRAWVEHGAPWPEDLRLQSAKERSLAPRRPALPPLRDGGPRHPVDRLLEAHARAHGLSFEEVEDRRFVRRVSLDLLGLLPEPAMVDAFLADPGPDRHRRLVRSLLEDRRGYAEHWLSFWNDHLRNAYAGTGFIDGGRAQITGFLVRSLYENLPYDRFVRALLDPGEDASGFLRGIRWRGVVNASQQPALQAAQTVSQVFLGTNLKCASCHDSFVDPWKLEDAYAFAAVFADRPLELHRCDQPTGQVARPAFLYPQLGEIAADAPREERLRRLAELITSPGNGRLARTLVNRVWARLFGAGLIEPLDDLDAPSALPDVLDFLACDFTDHGSDLHHLLETICTSRAYRSRALDLPADPRRTPVFAGPAVRRMQAEQFVDGVCAVLGVWPEVQDGMRRLDGRGQGGQWRAAALARAQDPAEASTARWIWGHADAARTDPGGTWFALRRFETASLARLSVLAHCDNELILWLDGERLGASTDWASGLRAEVAALPAGPHLLAVEATNWPDRERGRGAQIAGGSPAGLLVRARVEFEDGTTETLDSDARWSLASTEPRGWPRPADPDAAGAALVPAVEIAPADGGPWRLDAALDPVDDGGPVRAGLCPADDLQRALGRPAREQVVTRREPAPTLLMALELVNGSTLDGLLRRGAEAWRAEAMEPDAMVDRAFLRGLGRPPTKEERAVAASLLGEQPGVEEICDLVWAVVMLPEFQLIQ